MSTFLRLNIGPVFDLHTIVSQLISFQTTYVHLQTFPTNSVPSILSIPVARTHTAQRSAYPWKNLCPRPTSVPPIPHITTRLHRTSSGIATAHFYIVTTQSLAALAGRRRMRHDRSCYDLDASVTSPCLVLFRLCPLFVSYLD